MKGVKLFNILIGFNSRGFKIDNCLVAFSLCKLNGSCNLIRLQKCKKGISNKSTCVPGENVQLYYIEKYGILSFALGDIFGDSQPQT